MNALTPSTFRRITVRAMAALVATLLAACGGGDPPEQTTPPRLEMTGTVVGGDTSSPDTFAATTAAKGASGLMRTSEVARGSLDYAVSLSALTGPYALSGYFDNGVDQLTLVSLATAPGVANMTPLTHLMVAQLFGQDPESVFNAFDAELAARVTQANLDQVQREVVAFLQEELGVSIDPAVGDFLTTPFEPTPGDPMYDAILAVRGRLEAEAIPLGTFVERLALAARLCIAEKVVLTINGRMTDFCPASKSAVPREGDSTLFDYAFTDRRGNVLALEVRGDQVQSVRYTPVGAMAFGCSASVCAAARLGVPAGDLSRSIAFSDLTLSNASGSVVVSGSLGGAVPGVALPPVPCDANQYFVIRPDRSVSGYCAGPDDYEVGAGGSGGISGATRVRYLFLPVTDDPVGQRLEVTVDADTVVQALLYTSDANTGENTAPYLCRGAGCAGATLGPVRVVNTPGGFDLLLRDIELNGTVLAAVTADGSLSETDTVGLQATLVGATFPPAPGGFSSAPCASPDNRVIATPSEGPAPIDVCVPSDPPEGFLLSGYVVEDAGATLFVINLLTDGMGGSATGDQINVSLNEAGEVSRVTYFSTNNGQGQVAYRCIGAACAGVSVSAPDGDGVRIVTFANTVVTEVGSLDIAGDRIAELNGSFAAPPVP